MFRALATRGASAFRGATMQVRPGQVAPSVRLMSSSMESDAEFDARYIAYFDRADIDGWEIRKGMGDLCAMDLVPEPPHHRLRLESLQEGQRLLSHHQNSGDCQDQVWSQGI